MRCTAILLVSALGSSASAATGPLGVESRLGSAPLGPGFEVHYGDGPDPDRPPTSGWEVPGRETPWAPVFEPDRWTGVAWLKVPLQVEPEWAGADLTLWIQRLTPVSIYLDGRQIHTSGHGEAFDRIHAAASLEFDVHDMVYVEGYVVLLISISSYLARSFAKTQDRLEVKLAEVQSLSEHALDQERQLKEDGMGLGLSIAWKTLKAHGGDIGVESQPGEGATVTLSIPIEPVAGL